MNSPFLLFLCANQLVVKTQFLRSKGLKSIPSKMLKRKLQIHLVLAKVLEYEYESQYPYLSPVNLLFLIFFGFRGIFSKVSYDCIDHEEYAIC